MHMHTYTFLHFVRYIHGEYNVRKYACMCKNIYIYIYIYI